MVFIWDSPLASKLVELQRHLQDSLLSCIDARIVRTTIDTQNSIGRRFRARFVKQVTGACKITYTRRVDNSDVEIEPGFWHLASVSSEYVKALSVELWRSRFAQFVVKPGEIVNIDTTLSVKGITVCAPFSKVAKDKMEAKKRELSSRIVFYIN